MIDFKFAFKRKKKSRIGMGEATKLLNSKPITLPCLHIEFVILPIPMKPFISEQNKNSKHKRLKFTSGSTFNFLPDIFSNAYTFMRAETA